MINYGTFGIKPEEKKTNSTPTKPNDGHKDFVVRLKDAIDSARDRGFTTEEIKHFILYGKTERMSFMEVRNLERIAILINRYKGDRQELVRELFDKDEMKEFISFKYKHPKTAAIPIIGQLIANIADLVEKRRIQKAVKDRENKEYLGQNIDNDTANTQERRNSFIESLKVTEYKHKDINISNQTRNRRMPKIERV